VPREIIKHAMEGASTNPMPLNVLMRKQILSQRDMRDVEREIIRQLGGESRQCAFLRSAAFITLRLAAMYPTLAGLESKAPLTAYAGRFSLTATFEGGVGVVTMRNCDNLEYNDKAAADMEGPDEEENPPERGAKRRAV
jgi:hypothetical protein